MQWVVYGLIDPRWGRVFYIGSTSAPRKRAQQHKTDPCSSAYTRIHQIHCAGLHCTMKILKRFPDEKSARAHEKLLIGSTLGLTNRVGAWRKQ